MGGGVVGRIDAQQSCHSLGIGLGLVRTYKLEHSLIDLIITSIPSFLLGDSGRVVNSLDFCPTSLKSLGCFYFGVYFLHNGMQ